MLNYGFGAAAATAEMILPATSSAELRICPSCNPKVFLVRASSRCHTRAHLFFCGKRAFQGLFRCQHTGGKIMIYLRARNHTSVRSLGRTRRWDATARSQWLCLRCSARTVNSINPRTHIEVATGEPKRRPTNGAEQRMRICKDYRRLFGWRAKGEGGRRAVMPSGRAESRPFIMISHSTGRPNSCSAPET